MSRFTVARVFPLAALALVAGACSDSGAPSNQGQLSFNTATQAAPAASGGALAVVGTPETFTDGTNTLVVSGVELVLREIELHKAGVIAECSTTIDDDCEKLEIGPVLVDLPLGTPGGARSFNVALQPGSYDRVEFEIHKPSSSSDAGFVTAHPELDGVSIRVTGTYNGVDFTYTGDFDDEMEFNLVPELIVAETGTADLTLFASLDSWFRDAGGALIDPASANPGGSNQGLVEQNIKSSLDAFEDENHDGRDDGPNHQ
jgi:hypothetical protein